MRKFMCFPDTCLFTNREHDSKLTAYLNICETNKCQFPRADRSFSQSNNIWPDIYYYIFNCITVAQKFIENKQYVQIEIDRSMSQRRARHIAFYNKTLRWWIVRYSRLSNKIGCITESGIWKLDYTKNTKESAWHYEVGILYAHNKIRNEYSHVRHGRHWNVVQCLRHYVYWATQSDSHIRRIIRRIEVHVWLTGFTTTIGYNMCDAAKCFARLCCAINRPTQIQLAKRHASWSRTNEHCEKRSLKGR